MNDYRELSQIIYEAENIVFFGGAGVSTESDIPDFRGSSGLYNESDRDIRPEEILHHDYFVRNPESFYEYYRTHMIYPNAEPNDAHYALAKLEKEGRLSAVITQNIDGLHQLAGSENVIELHGSVHRNYCVKCGKRFGLDIVTESQGYPVCDKCGGLIRPDVVLYGESLDSNALYEAEEAVDSADVLIVGGTSLTVYPAAGLVAGFHGEHLIIINQTPTQYDGLAELVISDPIGEVLGKIVLDD